MVFSADSQIYRNLSAKTAEGMPFFRGNVVGEEDECSSQAVAFVSIRAIIPVLRTSAG